jgi:hypothetical protein
LGYRGNKRRRRSRTSRLDRSLAQLTPRWRGPRDENRRWLGAHRQGLRSLSARARRR